METEINESNLTPIVIIDESETQEFIIYDQVYNIFDDILKDIPKEKFVPIIIGTIPTID